jgi:hypothetical protein
MSFLNQLPNDPYLWYWAAFVTVVLGLQVATFFFKEHPNNPPLSPRVQGLLLWSARVHAMFCVWYLGAMFHVTPTVLTPPDKQLMYIYHMEKAVETTHIRYLLLTASTRSGTLNLKFLGQPLTLPWLLLIVSRDRDAVPATWIVFVTLDVAHHALTYSYLGRLWGQGDGGAVGKRVLQWSMVAHLATGILGDVGALVVRRFVDAAYVGENWRDGSTTAILALHLVTALLEMIGVEEDATLDAIAGLLRKVDPTLARLGLVAARDTKKTPPAPAPAPATREKDHGGRQSADEPGPGR